MVSYSSGLGPNVFPELGQQHTLLIPLRVLGTLAGLVGRGKVLTDKHLKDQFECMYLGVPQQMACGWLYFYRLCCRVPVGLRMEQVDLTLLWRPGAALGR